MPNPTVSVVIPAYNYAHFVGEAIESVLAQTYEDFEVLVIDDGSTDNTREVVQAYVDKDNRVRYVYKDNAGLSAARNTGIEIATGAYIAFLDADDLWTCEKLERTMERFAKLGPGWGLVATLRSVTTADGALVPQKSFGASEDQEVTFRQLLLHTYFSPSAVVVRKSCFDRSGYFDTSLTSVEDRDMWLRIAANDRMYCIGERLALIRNHSASMSKHADRMKANFLVVWRKNRESGVLSKWDPCWMRSYSFYMFQCAWMYADAGSRMCAVSHIFRSVVTWPIFLHSSELHEPPLFRLRAAARFILVGK